MRRVAENFPFSSPTPAGTQEVGCICKGSMSVGLCPGEIGKRPFRFMYTFLNLQRELEQENAALKESKNECERSLQHHQLELKKLKVFI